MSGKSTIDQIRHYQKDIEKCPENTERMLRCIHRLYVLPITLEHLQETGVGRSVNSLRKYKGEVGDAAKALVTKWKAMVAAEESEEEATQVPPSKPRENKAKSPPPVTSERKSDHSSKESSEKSKIKEQSSNNNNVKHHSHKKSSQEKSHGSNSSKSSEKHIDSKSASLKRSHSSSSSSNHRVGKESKSSSHKNHKTHYDKKHKIEDEESSPPPEKKHKSHSRDHSSKKRKMSSESEEESDASEESEVERESDVGSPARDSEEESEAASESSKSDGESDSNSDSDHRHRSKKHGSSHHNHKHSSHSKDRDKEKKKQIEQKYKEKEKNKENHSHNKHSEKHSSRKKSSSPDYKDLIKENEKKIKKEKKEEFVSPKIVLSKPVKIETNEDGSIDSGSGASFADALLGMDVYEKKKSKKTSSGNVASQSQKPKSSKSSSSNNSSSSKAEEKLKTPKASSSSSSSRSIDELVEPPELLTKKVKLEALDLDISSTLPEINPNYKPLPHIPERLRQPKTMSDEDHMFSIMTTKNQRTKVYSGNKSCLTSVPTLFSMCIQLLYDNIDAVEYTGGVPYQLLKPLLQKLNADQLYVLEHFNPYLIEDTDELWKFHAQKEFRNEKRQDMESWRELYVRCMDERERKLKALTANITQSMANSTPVRQAKLAYVDAVVKPPRNVARKQAKFGTGNTSVAPKNPTKHEIVSKAVVGGNTPGLSVKDTVPPPPVSARAAAHHPTPALLKKKKAPLMQKALQVMKGTRYKR